MKKHGFTLMEIMVVVAIIVILAGLAVPHLLRARFNAEESRAASNIFTIALAQMQWKTINGAFATLANLASGSPSYVDSSFSDGQKQGYSYNVTVVGESGNQFYACAVHQIGGAHSFYVDERGTICRSTNAGQSCPASHMSGACTGLWAGLQESTGSSGGPTGTTKETSTAFMSGAAMGFSQMQQAMQGYAQ